MEKNKIGIHLLPYTSIYGNMENNSRYINVLLWKVNVLKLYNTEYVLKSQRWQGFLKNKVLRKILIKQLHNLKLSHI